MLRLEITDALLAKQPQTTKHKKTQNTYARQLFEELIIKYLPTKKFSVERQACTNPCLFQKGLKICVESKHPEQENNLERV